MSSSIIRAIGALLAGAALARAQCSGSTYSYGSGACASCPAGATFVSAAAGCTPPAADGPGPTDTAFYLSGSAAEGVAAFTLTGPAPTFVADNRGRADAAMSLAAGSYLASAAFGSSPATLPAQSFLLDPPLPPPRRRKQAVQRRPDPRRRIIVVLVVVVVVDTTTMTIVRGGEVHLVDLHFAGGVVIVVFSSSSSSSFANAVGRGGWRWFLLLLGWRDLDERDRRRLRHREGRSRR